jgi:RNA polymerase sigma-70 factor (ECF subfamily)
MAQADARTDEQLMRDSAAGDLDAFDRLVRRYERRILSYAWRILGDAEAARDIYQQTFLNIIERREHYQATARFSTYVYCVAHNLCQNEVRRRKRHRAASLERPLSADEQADLRQWLTADTGEPDAPLARDEEDRLLHAAIDALDPIYREVISLRIFEGLPFHDIAGITGANESTVKSRMRYALAYLDRALRSKLGDG